MRRVVSLWLPTFATDRLARRRTRARRPDVDAAAPSPALPLATVAAVHGGTRVVAVDHAAAMAGVMPGLALAEARAVLPDLRVADADPAGDRRALQGLADWCGRYTPWTAVDDAGPRAGGSGGDAGIWLDISGCAHLFGGEAALLADLEARLRGFGIAAVAAVADAPGAAWAVARFGDEEAAVVPPDGTDRVLAPLPVAGLRLPGALVADLDLVGLRRIGDLAALPRAPLAERFGETVPKRLDQAFGKRHEPVSPRRPVPAMAARLAFAEPVGRREDVAAAAQHLLAELCARLEAARRGARRVELTLYRTDGTVARTAVGTSRPVREPGHLWRLLAEKLDALDPGFGIETAVLAATVVDPLAPVQTSLDAGGQPPAEKLTRLVDRLGNRLDPANVVRLVEHASHIPERACRALPATASPSPPRNGGAGERSRQPRPLTLLPWPEPIEVLAPVPDGPPALIRRGRTRHRVIAAEGPERIGPEWWLEDAGLDPERQSRIRDYYRVEDDAGRRFWVYREGLYRPGVRPRWYLHGLFA